jgi:hypothetical protein
MNGILLAVPFVLNMSRYNRDASRVVLRSIYLRRKQLQLPALSLFIENFDRLEPTGLGVVIRATVIL